MMKTFKKIDPTPRPYVPPPPKVKRKVKTVHGVRVGRGAMMHYRAVDGTSIKRYRVPGTVVEVTKRTITVQEDFAPDTSDAFAKNVFIPNPDGALFVFRHLSGRGWKSGKRKLYLRKVR